MHKMLLAGFFILLFGGMGQLKAQICATDTVILNLAPYVGSVQWEESTDGITWTPISGATLDSLVTLPGQRTWYRAMITEGTCNPIYSDTAEVVPASVPSVTANGSLNLCQGASLTLTSSTGVSYMWSTGDTTQSITVSTGGNYTVTVTDANGCSISSVSVPVVSVPPVVADAGNDTTLNCGMPHTIGGSPTAVSGTGPFTYLWTPGIGLNDSTIANPAANPFGITNYVVTVTDSFGCSGMDTVVITPAVVPDSIPFLFTGTIVHWHVPPCVNTITVKGSGAKGGNSTWSTLRQGGAGAFIQGTFSVTPGQALLILVGQQGESAAVGGGGGGTYVVDSATGQPLIVAGGGGGASSDQAGVSAVLGQNGTMDSQNIIAGGTGGNGGSACSLYGNNGGGGGGMFGNGQDANTVGSGQNGGFGGKSFANGGAGGAPGRLDGACTGDAFGGFGGGGSTTCNTVGGGGGGGYSGGAGGPHISQCSAPVRSGGGGGGSFNGGTNQLNIPNVGTGNGAVMIRW